MLRAGWSRFARDHPDVAVGKIDATKRMNERLADAHGADSYPTLRFRKERFYGVRRL